MRVFSFGELGGKRSEELEGGEMGGCTDILMTQKETS